MIKVVNLDKFAIRQKFSIGGQEYSVRGLTLGEQIEGAAANIKLPEQMRERLKEITDMPEDVVAGLDDRQMGAIIMLSRGVELNDDEPEEETEKKTES